MARSGSSVAPRPAMRSWNALSFSAAFSAAPTLLSEDVTVPRDKIAVLIKKCNDIGQKYGFPIHIAGHAGDGNLHPAILTDINDKDNFGKAMQAVDEMILATLDLGGVISGEHGIGLEKKRFMKVGLDPVTLNIMRGIKKVFDPNGILNPGKYWED